MSEKKNFIIKIGFSAIILVILILIISLQIRIRSLESEKELLQKTIEDYRLIVEEMEYDMELSREDYIEKYAREVLGYHKYSDIIIKEPTDK